MMEDVDIEHSSETTWFDKLKSKIEELENNNLTGD